MTIPATGVEAELEPKRPDRSLLSQLPIPLYLAGILVLIQHASDEDWPGRLCLLVGFAGLMGLLYFWPVRAGLFARLRSVPFAAVAVASVGVATAIGTLVPQGAKDTELELRYGIRAADWLQWFYVDDLFRSFWFSGLLALLALSLASVVAKRPFWRLAQWGFTFTHGGVAVVLLGALVGTLFGERGTMELRVGQENSRLAIQEGGQATGERRALPFALKLEEFEVENYPAQNAIYVYKAGKDGQHPVAVRSVPVGKANEWVPVPDTEAAFRVREYFPDIQVSETMVPSDDAGQPAAARIVVEVAGKRQDGWLTSGGRGADFHAQGLRIELIWPGPQAEAGAAWLERTAKASTARHIVSGPGGTPIEVEVGATYAAPGLDQRFKVIEFIPDFYYDMEKKRGASRGEAPNNPALQVEEVAAGPEAAPRRQWLFSRMPGHGAKKGDMPLKYRFEAATKPIVNLIRIDGRARKIAYATAGKLALERPFETGKAERIELAAGPCEAAEAKANVVALEIAELLERARPKVIARGGSDEPKNPGVVLEIRRAKDGPVEESVLVAGARGMASLDGQTALAFAEGRPEVKAFRSKVAIVQDKETVERATIEVNAPLSFGGYTFYQSDYRPEDPGFSGLKVVCDPGLGLVYAGMIAASLGVAMLFYLRPRASRAGQAAAPVGGN